CGEPLRADRRGCLELAVDDTAGRDDVELLAVHGDRVEHVLVVRPRVRDVMRVERRQDAREHDQQEQGERGEGEVIPPQPPPREVPGAAAADRRAAALHRGQLGGRVEGELALSPLRHSPPPFGEKDAGGAATGAPGPASLVLAYFLQIVAKSNW